jgi:hypothetical protein
MDSGVAATRFSRSNRSLGIPMVSFEYGVPVLLLLLLLLKWRKTLPPLNTRRVATDRNIMVVIFILFGLLCLFI